MKSTSNQNKLKTKFIYRISNKITQSLISILQGSITVLSVSKRFKGQIAHQSLALWEALLMTSVLRRAHNKIDHSWKRKQAHMRENEKKIVKNITCTIACGGALLAVRPTLFQPMWVCGRFVRVPDPSSTFRSYLSLARLAHRFESRRFAARTALKMRAC